MGTIKEVLHQARGDVMFKLPNDCVNQMSSWTNRPIGSFMDTYHFSLALDPYMTFPQQCCSCLATADLVSRRVNPEWLVTSPGITPPVMAHLSVEVPICRTCLENVGKDPRTLFAAKYPEAMNYKNGENTRMGVVALIVFVLVILVLQAVIHDLRIRLGLAALLAGGAALSMEQWWIPLMASLGKLPPDYEAFAEEYGHFINGSQQHTEQIIFPPALTAQDFGPRRQIDGLVKDYLWTKRFGIRFRNAAYAALFEQANTGGLPKITPASVSKPTPALSVSRPPAEITISEVRELPLEPISILDSNDMLSVGFSYQIGHESLAKLLDAVECVPDRAAAVAFFKALNIDNPVDWQTPHDVFRSTISVVSVGKGDTTVTAWAVAEKSLGEKPNVLVVASCGQVLSTVLLCVKLASGSYLARYVMDDSVLDRFNLPR